MNVLKEKIHLDNLNGIISVYTTRKMFSITDNLYKAFCLEMKH